MGLLCPKSKAWPILCEYSSRCSPPWSESELRHKMESAGKLTRHPHPRGHLSSVTHRHEVGISIAHVRVVKPAPTFSEMRKISAPLPLSTTDSETSVANRKNEGEAQRIAGELLKLHRDGAMAGPDDPQFYAQLIHAFGGTYIGRNGTPNV